MREAWRVCGGREYEYQQDRSQVMYHATHQEDGFPLTWESYKWRPSIHMPRWASRITLEVTGVRVERLQDISEADAMAEGAPSADLASGRECIFPHQGTHRWGFRLLWESINSRPKLPPNPASLRYARVKRWLEKHPDTTSWDANPWVWVVSFKRVEVSNA